MSKFLNIFAPAMGGTAGVLGLAYLVADQFVVDIPAPARMVLVPGAQAQDSTPTATETAAMAAPTAAPSVDSAFEVASLIRKGGYGIGRTALPEEVAAWNVDVAPDGTGLPDGSGSVEDGEMLFSEHCAVCHGEFAEGVDNWPKLAGGDDTLADEDPVKTVGSYWPYASTVWDYVHRSMPYGNAQSLSDDDTYAIVAYILYSNFIVDDDFVLTKDNFTEITMPNADGFFVDDRDQVEVPLFSKEPCMSDCKDSIDVVKRAADVNVTPGQDLTAARALIPGQVTASAAAAVAAVTESAPTAAPEVAEAVAGDGADAALVEKGAKVFKKCQACHQVGDGAKNRTGPLLTGVVGRGAGAVDGFRYSGPMQDAAANGLVWTSEELHGFLKSPRKYLKGTSMGFAGLRKDEEIDAVIAYIESNS